MLDAIKPLLDSDLVNEDTKQEIQEAWEAKLSETKEEVRAELREEFARRYEHDKSVMVEALDRMVTENLTKELEEFALKLESIVIKTVESGYMTKDLAMLIGNNHKWLSTTQFIDKVEENLLKAI